MREIGKTYSVKYPYIRVEVTLFDDPDGPYTIESWQPGVRDEFCAPDDSEAVADGEGEMLFTIVDIHKPGDYPERTFYTRKWKDPDGKVFGKSRLHIKSTTAVDRLLRGYGYEYRLKGA